MSATSLKLVRIGNSQGVRLPKTLQRKYGWTDVIVAEERPEGLLLRRSKRGKLSWEDTFKAMAVSGERWDDWDDTVGDGIDS